MGEKNFVKYLNNFILGNFDAKEFEINIKDIVVNKRTDAFLGRYKKSHFMYNNNQIGEALIMHTFRKEALKNEFLRSFIPFNKIYAREHFIYTNVIPTFLEFQSEEKINLFMNFPKYFNSGQSTEVIVMEDVTKNSNAHWVQVESNLVLDRNHIIVAVQQYAKFHALSFAYKHKRPKEFKILTANLEECYYSNIDPSNLHRFGFDRFCDKLLNMLPKEMPLNNKLKNLTLEMFNLVRKLSSSTYKPEHNVIVHGDANISNIFFTYETQRPIWNMPSSPGTKRHPVFKYYPADTTSNKTSYSTALNIAGEFLKSVSISSLSHQQSSGSQTVLIDSTGVDVNDVRLSKKHTKSFEKLPFKQDFPSPLEEKCANKDKLPEEICLVDFQFAHMGSPALDVVNLIMTSTNKQTRKESLGKIISAYDVVMRESLEQFGLEQNDVYSIRDLLNEMYDLAIVGWFNAILTLYYKTSNLSDVPDIATVKNDEELKTFYGYKNSKENEFLCRMEELIDDLVVNGADLFNGYLSDT